MIESSRYDFDCTSCIHNEVCKYQNAYAEKVMKLRDEVDAQEEDFVKLTCNPLNINPNPITYPGFIYSDTDTINKDNHNTITTYSIST